MIEIRTYGAVDIGSNAVRLLVSDVVEGARGPQFRKVTLARVPIRLGQDVFTGGRVSDELRGLLLEAVEGFAHLLRAYRVSRWRACATSAMREAANGADIVAQIRDRAGIEVEVIDGEQEARLIQDGGVAAMQDPGRPYLYADVGGGSTELTLYAGGRRISSRSFAVGTVRALAQAVDPAQRDGMRLWLAQARGDGKRPVVVGSGGNINKFQKMAGGKEGSPIALRRLRRTRDALARLTVDERVERLGLSLQRAEVIVPALDIFADVMRAAGARHLVVPKIGLADGIIRQLYLTDCRGIN